MIVGFHQLLQYRRDNATNILRKFLVVMLLTSRTIVVCIKFTWNERAKGVDIPIGWIIDIVSDAIQRNARTNCDLSFITSTKL
jgi:hypothetical protein